VSEVIFGRHAVLEALKAGSGIEEVMLAVGTRPAPILEQITQLATKRSVPVSQVPRSRLHQLTGVDSHQGVAAKVGAFSYASLDAIAIPGAKLVLLDGVTDPVNLGSVLRTAEAFGWAGVLVPRHRTAGVTAAVRKVSAGASERVPVAQVGSAADTLKTLARKGFWAVGLHPGSDIDYRDIDLWDQSVCLVLGAEGRGLSPLVRQRCDQLVKVPMAGSLASLNVAVAAAVVMVEVTRNRGG